MSWQTDKKLLRQKVTLTKSGLDKKWPGQRLASTKNGFDKKWPNVVPVNFVEWRLVKSSVDKKSSRFVEAVVAEWYPRLS